MGLLEKLKEEKTRRELKGKIGDMLVTEFQSNSSGNLGTLNPNCIRENFNLFSFELVQKGMDQPASLDLSKTMIDASRII